MTSIRELGNNIARNSILVEEWLSSQNIRAASFEQDAEQEFPSTVGAKEVEAARLAIVNDTRTIHDLLIGPGEVLRRICWGVSAIDPFLQ